MEQVRTDIVVVGAGVIGLAIARELASRGREVAVVEAEPRPGMIISSRNSEVIHAGLYYEPGSLKARFCVAGNRMLYAYARERGLEYKDCGKLVVAAENQLAELKALQERAEANGVTGMRRLSASEARAMEEQVLCAAALHVPQSGMINTHELLLSFGKEAEERGATILLNTKVISGNVGKQPLLLLAETETRKGEKDRYEIACNLVINAAGLGAQELSKNLGLLSQTIPKQMLGKGNYYKLAGQPSPFTMMIYPMQKPFEAGSPFTAGLHARLDFDRRTTVFGPSLRIVDAIDYNVDADCLPEFRQTIEGYWRNAASAGLEPYYAGIRPKLKGHSDFMIQGPRQHGAEGVIALYGIESPGLTSSLALAYALAEQIAPRKNGTTEHNVPGIPFALL